MAQRHWLDPLARRLLQATGQLPPDPARARPAGSTAASQPLRPSDHDSAVERDLLVLKLRQNPSLKLSSAEEVRHLAALGWELDVNRASRRDWLRLPGIETDQVDLLMRLQAGGVQLSGIDDLKRLLELDDTVVACWQPVLTFRWYGEPPGADPPRAPLDLNRATQRQLSELGLSAERCRRLLRERARRPFQDLADLQERLQLPAAVVESWIGKVRFSPGSGGPVLPRPLRR
jgi:hypothetical protein